MGDGAAAEAVFLAVEGGVENAAGLFAGCAEVEPPATVAFVLKKVGCHGCKHTLPTSGLGRGDVLCVDNGRHPVDDSSGKRLAAGVIGHDKPDIVGETSGKQFHFGKRMNGHGSIFFIKTLREHLHEQGEIG